MFGLTKRSFFREFRRSLRDFRFRPSLSLCLFEEGFSIGLFGLYIPLVWLDRWAYDPHEIMESWGACYFERAIQFTWGRHCKIVHMPWDFEHLKHEVRRPDGTWAAFVGSWETGQPIKNTEGVKVFEGGKQPDGREQWQFPYTYTLKSGEVQHRTATVFVERREWRWRSLMWCPWPAIKRQTIDVHFDGEVGERTGSWKGGCIGCGYEMRPGETAEQTLRRMERERVFE